MASRSIQDWLSEYGKSHQHPVNKQIHWLCVPIIFWSISALLWTIPIPFLSFSGLSLNVGLIALLFILFYYFLLSFSLALGMTAFTTFCLMLSYQIEQMLGITGLRLLSIILFIIAWIGQFYGHRLEGKKPSFLEDIQFLMIGPAWLLHFIYKRLKISL